MTYFVDPEQDATDDVVADDQTTEEMPQVGEDEGTEEADQAGDGEATEETPEA